MFVGRGLEDLSETPSVWSESQTDGAIFLLGHKKLILSGKFSANAIAVNGARAFSERKELLNTGELVRVSYQMF